MYVQHVNGGVGWGEGKELMSQFTLYPVFNVCACPGRCGMGRDGVWGVLNNKSGL